MHTDKGINAASVGEIIVQVSYKILNITKRVCCVVSFELRTSGNRIGIKNGSRGEYS